MWTSERIREKIVMRGFRKRAKVNIGCRFLLFPFYSIRFRGPALFSLLFQIRTECKEYIENIGGDLKWVEREGGLGGVPQRCSEVRR